MRGLQERVGSLEGDAVRTAGLAVYDGMLRRWSVTIKDAEKAAAL